MLLSQLANVGYDLTDLFFGQFAIVGRHFVFAFRYDVRELGIRLTLHFGRTQVAGTEFFSIGTSPFPSCPWQAAHLVLNRLSPVLWA